MATKVGIAETNISASQMIEFFRLAAIPGSRINRSTLQAYLEGRNPFGDPDFVRVDRSLRPAYPDFVEKGYVDTEEFIRLEQTGPTEYQLSSLSLSLHPKQEEDGVATGHEVWKYQKELGIEDCLSLRDLEEIQKLGLATFRKYFKNKEVFAWKSVMPNGHDTLFVPYLFGNGSQVILYWRWIGDVWNANRPVLRFARQAR